MRVRAWAVLLLIVLLLAGMAGLFQGCRKERPGFERNLPPETFLSSVPLDSTYVFYRVRLYWGGLDPDGQVVGYFYAVTDSNIAVAETSWVFTTATDMEFSLTANNPEMLGHRFYCRAVDERGLVDPTPAFVFFYARDFNLPKVTFTKSYAVSPRAEIIPLSASNRTQLFDSIPGDTVPTGSYLHFAWRGWDDDPGGYLTGFLYRTSDDATYRGGTLADTSFSTQVTRMGLISVEVRAIDDAGARSRPDTARYVVVNNDPDTRLLPPCEGCPKGFMEGGSIPRREGDTLRLTGDVKVAFSWDSWDKDGFVIGWSHRLTRYGGGPAYLQVNNTTWESATLVSSDYEFMVRARDNEMKDEGAPAICKFYVNCAPYFEGQRRCCTCTGDPIECTLQCKNAVGVVGSVVIDTLDCAACDLDGPNGRAIEYQTILNGHEGPWRGGPGTSGENVDILTASDGLTSGWNTVIIRARDHQPDGTIARQVETTRTFYVDVPVPQGK
ncbi:MAG: hypothetical protein V2A71_02695 [Candidatus Eisenbacteria bacterium]